jgi:hypothetical protein
MADGGFLSYLPSSCLVGEAQRFSPGTEVRTARGEESLRFSCLPSSWWASVRPDTKARATARAPPAVLFGSSILALTLFQKRSVYHLVIFTALALAEVIVSATVLARRARRPGSLCRSAPPSRWPWSGPEPARGFHAYAGTPRIGLSRRSNGCALDPPPRTP